MVLIVGLGNPGRTYASTRHNIGFRIVDRLAARTGGRWRTVEAGGSAIADIAVAGKPVLLLKPQRFMNVSGGPVARLAQRRRIAPTSVWIVLDDLDLPFGHLRLRPSGSAGGHHGLQSVLEHLKTDAVPRLRVGIGPAHKTARFDGARYVLNLFTATERRRLPDIVDRAADALELGLTQGLEAAMTVWNRKGSARYRP